MNHGVDLSTCVLQVHEVLSKASGKGRKVESVTIYKDEMFFSESFDSTIRRCNKNKCNESTVLRNNTREYILEDVVPFRLSSIENH